MRYGELFSMPSMSAPLTELRREMDRLFENYGGFGTGSARPGVFPAVNIWDDAENLYAEAEIPGVAKEDIEIFAVGNELTIRGQRRPNGGEGVSYHRQERGTGEFSRVVTLPIDVAADKVDARLCNGVLCMTLPKAEEMKPRKINVQASA